MQLAYNISLIPQDGQVFYYALVSTPGMHDMTLCDDSFHL